MAIVFVNRNRLAEVLSEILQGIRGTRDEIWLPLECADRINCSDDWVLELTEAGFFFDEELFWARVQSYR